MLKYCDMKSKCCLLSHWWKWDGCLQATDHLFFLFKKMLLFVFSKMSFSITVTNLTLVKVMKTLKNNYFNTRCNFKYEDEK